MLFIILYIVLGYWAVGRTIYANKVVIYSGDKFFWQKLTWGMLFGWALIPWALLKMLFGK